MRLPVRVVLKLVGKEPASGNGRIRCLCGCEGARKVDELLFVDYGGGRDERDEGAEVEEEGGFLDGLVGGHADVGFVAAGAAEEGEGDASGADGAFVDFVAAVGGEEAGGFGLEGVLVCWFLFCIGASGGTVWMSFRATRSLTEPPGSRNCVLLEGL